MDSNISAIDSMAGNSSSYPLLHHHGSTTFIMIYDLILSIIGVFIILTNGIVIIIYASSHRLRRKSANLLLFNQSLVDIFHGIVTNGITLFGHHEFVARQIIYQFSLALGLHTVVLVSIERYVFILKPLIHKRMITIGRMRTAVIITWFSSLLWIPFRMAHLTDSDIDFKSYTMYYIAISDAVFLILIILMTYLHVSTFRAVRNFIKARHSKIVGVSIRRSPSHHRQLRLRRHIKELRVTKIFMSMFIAFIISYVPLFVTGLVHISGKSTSFSEIDHNYMSLDVIFYLFNCLFNPLVTITCKEDYKCIFKQWTKKCRQLLFCYSNMASKNDDHLSEKDALTPTLVENIGTSKEEKR